MTTMCSFCEKLPSRVAVELALGVSGNKESNFCWLHYYSTRAVRVGPKRARLLVEDEGAPADIKSSGVQSLFAEAYAELQQELGEESAQSFRTQSTDPLGILSTIRGKPKKPSARPPKAKDQYQQSGGFMKNVPLPGRYVETQAKLSHQLQQQTASATSKTRSLHARRKPSRQSIWKLAMKPAQENSEGVRNFSLPPVRCSCGSSDVSTTGNLTTRNNNIPKAEIWGLKDRSDIVNMFQCNKCGKRWNEEE